MTAALVERWTIRPADACVAFRGKANRFAPTVQARFTQVTGTVSETAVCVDVDVRSLTTGSAAYDEVIAKVDPFEVARHPLARFRSTGVCWTDEAAVVDGELSLRGRTAPVRLTARCVRLDDRRARLTAAGRVDRRVFGLDLPGCGPLLPHHLDLDIDVTAVRS